MNGRPAASNTLSRHRALLCGGPTGGAGDPKARVRLFCLPHVGGGASLYAPWRDPLTPGIEVVAVQLPGRESLLREAPFDRMQDIVEDVGDQVERQTERPYALLGHSMGALLAFELARAMRRRGRPGPVRLFVSGARAPHLKPRRHARHALPDAEFRAMLHDMGGTPEAVFRDPDLMAVFLPVLRADFAAYDGYGYRPEPPLDCAISVFGGMEDREATPSDIEAWAEHTNREIRTRMFPGGHFFLRTAVRQMVQAIREDLEQAGTVASSDGAIPESPLQRLKRVATWPTVRRGCDTETEAVRR